MIHGSRASPLRRSVAVICTAAEIAMGFGNVFGALVARTAVSAATLPFPLHSRKRANERIPAIARISERLPAPSLLLAAMKARTSAGESLANAFRFGAPT